MALYFLAACVPLSIGATIRGASDTVIVATESGDAAISEQHQLNEEIFVSREEEMKEEETDILIFGEEEFFILTCANESGSNPCGPGKACHDTETGITCDAIPDLQGCPAGCAPHSTCTPSGDEFSCECDTGFHRSAMLGCVAIMDGPEVAATLTQ